jgi:initiation factor 1A
MVKNQNGGKNSKKMGRKFVTNPSSNNRKIRKAEEEGEMYAIVTKMLGNGMFYANDIEGKERLCIMRNKFRGRGKRDNTVALGSWVLIGEREFESCAKPKHDLLEVYSDIEKQKLKHSGDPIFSKLRSDFDSKDDSNNEADGLVFDNGEDDKYNELLESVYANTELDADPDLDSGDEKTQPSTSTTSNIKIKNKTNDNKNTRPTLVIMDDGDEIDVDDI